MFNLKYLFEVEYFDGARFKQTRNDISEKDQKRSAYFDVIKDKVKIFTLKRFFDTWSINVQTGVFTHNGNIFQVEENPTGGTLEFFRQHQHDMVSGKETAHRVVYFLGYKRGKKKYLVGIK